MHQVHQSPKRDLHEILDIKLIERIRIFNAKFFTLSKGLPPPQIANRGHGHLSFSFMPTMPNYSKLKLKGGQYNTDVAQSCRQRPETAQTIPERAFQVANAVLLQLLAV